MRGHFNGEIQCLVLRGKDTDPNIPVWINHLNASATSLLDIPSDFTFPYTFLSCNICIASFEKECYGSWQMRHGFRVQLVALMIGSLKMHAAHKIFSVEQYK